GCAGRLRQGGCAGARVGNRDERVSTEKAGAGYRVCASNRLYAQKKRHGRKSVAFSFVLSNRAGNRAKRHGMPWRFSLLLRAIGRCGAISGARRRAAHRNRVPRAESRSAHPFRLSRR
ncbi:hypothetical protein QM306_29700, partial [Burkholderia cenocepacia]|nr:hypothetical protein [Burkholderia cenocepacia]